MTHFRKPIYPLSILLGVFTLLMSPQLSLASQALRSTPDASDPYFDALPWELADDVEEMKVHKVVDGDTLQLTYLDDDYYHPTRIIGIQAPELDGPYTE